MQEGYSLKNVADIAVDKTIYSFDKLFSYYIPDELLDAVIPGVRVLVPFGRGNSKKQAVVISVHQADVSDATKSIYKVIDNSPVLSEEMLEIVKYMVSHTFCTYYDAVRTILPNGLNYNIIPTYSLAKAISEIDFEHLDSSERALIGFLKIAHNANEINKFMDALSENQVNRVVERLEEKEIIKKNEDIKRRVSDKNVRMLRIPQNVSSQSMKLTPKQKCVVELVESAGAAEVKEACYFCGVTEAVIKNLVKLGAIEYYDREIMRIPEYKKLKPDDIVLNGEQQNVYRGIVSLLENKSPEVALLQGVTGSGKTRVFIELIKYVLSNGKQAVMLVPEISLTPQTVSVFKGEFGDKIAVLHSSLSMGEQLDEWKRIKNGDVQIAVGTRSAVFAPFDNLGLIIMDEEGEYSYKSDSSPRYHARDIAKFRCYKHNALLLLASATPCVESYYNAVKGTYHLFQLKNRFNNCSLPEVKIIDLKKEKIKGDISAELAGELEYNLNNKEQSVILLNRRGYNTFAQCVDCGSVIVCPNCSVAMSYHKANGYMMCHYCGKSEPPAQLCPECSGRHIKLVGTGTQKLEDEVSQLFPQAKVLRMDTDTTYSKYSFEKNFSSFKNGEYDIMIGTQMIAKGLNFPNVTLAAVVNADQSLYSGDYRCREKTFSLLTQIVGRSGRGGKTGRALIQTYLPEEPVIKYSASQDFNAFFEDEIEARKALIYPPFCDLCMLGVSGESERDVKKAADILARVIIDNYKKNNFNLPLKLLGPAPALIYKISGKYRYRIILKCIMNKKMRSFIKFILTGINKLDQFNNITVFADVNGEMGV